MGRREASFETPQSVRSAGLETVVFRPCQRQCINRRGKMGKEWLNFDPKEIDLILGVPDYGANHQN